MASFRISLLFIAAALLTVASASGYKPTSCCVKTQKCCVKFSKCGYEYKQIKQKKPIVHKVCGIKCDYKPYKYSKNICTTKRVPVPCKPNPYAIKPVVRDDDSDSDSGSGSGSGSDSGSDHVKKPYHPKPNPPKICYKNKNVCYLKWFTGKKKVCRNECKFVKGYQIIIKVYKYPRYCPRATCEKVQDKCTGKKLKGYVSKKGIYTKTIKGKKVVIGDKKY